MHQFIRGSIKRYSVPVVRCFENIFENCNGEDGAHFLAAPLSL